MSHRNVTKVVWYILVQLSYLNNTMSMVSGVSVQVSVRVHGSEVQKKAVRTTLNAGLLNVEPLSQAADT
jgi:ribosomal protein S9